MKIMFDKSLFLKLSIGFILATIIGTLSHELGHYAVAYFYGYKPHISYGYCTWELTLTKPYFNVKDDFYICLGGPLQTIFTGSFGLVRRRCRYRSKAICVLSYLHQYTKSVFLPSKR